MFDLQIIGLFLIAPEMHSSKIYNLEVLSFVISLQQFNVLLFLIYVEN